MDKIEGITPEQLKRLQDGGWEDEGQWDEPSWLRWIGDTPQRLAVTFNNTVWKAEPGSETSEEYPVEYVVDDYVKEADPFSWALEELDEWKGTQKVRESKGFATNQADRFAACADR